MKLKLCLESEKYFQEKTLSEKKKNKNRDIAIFRKLGRSKI